MTVNEETSFYSYSTLIFEVLSVGVHQVILKFYLRFPFWGPRSDIYLGLCQTDDLKIILGYT